MELPDGSARFLLNPRGLMWREVQLLHDVHERVQLNEAINLCKALEPYNLFFLEDPFPPEDNAWHRRMKDAGIDTLGMHLEVVTPELRHKIMPGKAQVSLNKYFDSFAAAVEVFGWGQVSTYILAGLGDTAEAILDISKRLTAIGVYPFVVPFVPVSGTPLESHPAPTSDFMGSVLGPLSQMVVDAGMRAEDIKAGCGRCGACSALATYERFRTAQVTA